MKQPKFKRPPSVNKSPTFNQLYGRPKKEPKKATDPDEYLNEHPSWRLNNAQMEHPFGWHDIDALTAASIRKKLADFESMTWAEILVKASDRNHHIPVTQLSPDAKKRLDSLKLGYDEILSLRLSGKERVFGVLEGRGVMHILWWDPDHGVCPAPKKHT